MLGFRIVNLCVCKVCELLCVCERFSVVVIIIVNSVFWLALPVNVGLELAELSTVHRLGWG